MLIVSVFSFHHAKRSYKFRHRRKIEFVLKREEKKTKLISKKKKIFNTEKQSNINFSGFQKNKIKPHLIAEVIRWKSNGINNNLFVCWDVGISATKFEFNFWRRWCVAERAVFKYLIFYFFLSLLNDVHLVFFCRLN